MAWDLLFTAALLALVLLGVRHWHFVRRQRAIEEIVADIAAERRPKGFAFYESPRFMRLGLELEKITQSRQALQKQAEAERFHLQAILSSMVEGVLVAGPDRVIQLANASLVSLFHLEEEPVGRTILGALRDPAVDRLVEATLQTGKPQTGEVAPSRADGTAAVHLMASAVALAESGDRRRGAVVVFHDISRLRELEELRRELVANVSHELRTPLSVIQGYLENLMDQPELPREEVGAILRIMQRHSHRLNALVGDMLTLSRLEARSEALEFEAVSLPAFAAELLEDWKLKLQARRLTAELRLDPALPPLRADRFRLQQVFNNLLDNAVRYSPEGGTITLRATADAARTVVEVEDNGPGIPAADLPHIFERFYRVDKGRSREGGGTGLGLSIVKQILAGHGGTVGARSVPGQGTVIVLEFPQAPAEP